MPVKEGSVLGEMSLLNGAPRTATITSETAVSGWKLAKAGFESILEQSPGLKKSLDALSEDRKKGIRPVLPESQIWISTALRAVEAQAKGIKVWQLLTGIGILLWAGSLVNHWYPVVNPADHELAYAVWMLLAGLLTLQGSCEGFLIGVERLGARYKWDGFISGTVGSLLSTIPEFVVIAFLVLIDPVAAYVTAMVTIFNNALAFSIYSFFLPKNKEGAFTMPRSMTKAGNEILIAGSAIALIAGLLMLVLRAEHISEVLTGPNLILIGLILIMIYGFYLLMLVRYYSEGKDEEGTLPPDPDRLGHNTSWTGIGVMFLVGIGGAYIGGESIGAFAETAIKKMGLPTIPTAAALAFFAGISEYIIVFKSHKRGELGIALSNVFGGLTQVMFLLLPFGMIVIGLAGFATGNPVYSIPINVGTILLMLFLYPLFQSLIQYLEQDKTVNNLDAAGMTGIYILLLYFLFSYSN
ncbi:MAG: hypothetical protein L6Q77_02005 [Bacteroidetes bacterium]|nr:hypothetical protein [Bacteroidota bacterium]